MWEIKIKEELTGFFKKNQLPLFGSLEERDKMPIWIKSRNTGKIVKQRVRNTKFRRRSIIRDEKDKFCFLTFQGEIAMTRCGW